MRATTVSEKNLLDLIASTMRTRGEGELTYVVVPLSAREYDAIVRGVVTRTDVAKGDMVRYKGRFGRVLKVGKGMAEIEMPDGVQSGRTTEMIVARGDASGIWAYSITSPLTLLAISKLVNWTDERVAMMSSFPDTTKRGEWDGIRMSQPPQIWAIFEKFVKPMVEGPNA